MRRGFFDASELEGLDDDGEQAAGGGGYHSPIDPGTMGDAELRRLAFRLMDITPLGADGRVEWLEDLAPHAAYTHPCRPHKSRHLFVSKRRVPGGNNGW